jgi:hypothetical protein
MSDQEVIQKSVTLGDYSDNPRGGVIYFGTGTWSRFGQVFPPDLEGLSLRESDFITVNSVDHEALWAGAVAIAITKVSSLSWEVEGDIPLRTRRAHELLMSSDANRGWVSNISKTLQDFLLTNNGAFVEIVRASTSLNSQIIGIIPLDSLRCTRTGDPEVPVIYQDLKGAQHEMKAYEVMEFSDMPSSRASMFGSGKCAAFRSYKSIYKLANIESYISDKVSGRRPLAVNLVSGLNDQQLRSVLSSAQAEADARGAIAYMGAIIAAIPGDTTPGIATIPLADFPDNFNRRDELDIAVLAYANNLGLDVQDLQPLTGQALGTGAQSQVLNDKAKGKGLASFRQQYTHALNMWVIPDLTTFAFIEKDWRDKKAQADYNTTTGNYVNESVKNGVITADQGLQVMVDENIYPKEFLQVDQTPDENLSDDEKPGELPADAIPVPTPAQPAPQQVSPADQAILDLMASQAKEAHDLAVRIKEMNHA